MVNKIAKKRFINSSMDKKYSIDSRRYTIDPNNDNFNTIDQSLKTKIDNLPVSIGKPYQGLLFSY
jgi:hypothetical protein